MKTNNLKINYKNIIMKNLTTKLVIVFTILLTISCQKQQEEIIHKNDTTLNEFSSLTYDSRINNLTFPINNGLLVFNDLNELKNTVSILEEEVNTYDDTFLRTYNSLSSEELDNLEEKIGFDEYTPLKTFITNNNFNALFLKQAKAEEEWLNNEELDITTDPDNHFVEDKALQAILNTQSEVMVGKAIYKMFDFGYIIIEDGSFNTLESIRRNPQNLAYKNVTIVGDNYVLKGAGCNSGKGKSNFKYNGSYRIKWKISHRTPITGRRVKATTINYKKKGKRWKKARAYTKCMAYGFISDLPGDCSKQLNFNPDNVYSDWNNKKSWYHKVWVETKTKSGWVKGYHYGIAGTSYTSTLTW